MSVGNDSQLQNLIDNSLNGDASAKKALIDHACDRLFHLTRKMLGNYPRLRRWEETDDVFQRGMMRLHRALEDVQVVSVRHFFNLAALQIRRELLDLTKHYFGPEGAAAHHHSDDPAGDDKNDRFVAPTSEPSDLAGWHEFHSKIEQLPEDERELVDLLFYEGLTQEEAANVLNVSVRTVKRRWQGAKIRLHKGLNSDER